MQAVHQRKLDLFLKNFHAMKSYMPLRLGFSKTLAAFMFAAQERKVDIDSIERIKQKLNALSYKKTEFRHAAELYLWTELALSNDEDKLIELAKQAYFALRKQGLNDPWVNAYVSLQMAKHLSVSGFDEHIKRLMLFRSTMRINHRLRVGRYSLVLVSMLFLTGIEPDLLTGRIEHVYALLKENAPQRLRNYTVAIILAMADDVEAQVLKFVELGNVLKRRGIAVVNRFCMNSLALLSFLPLEKTLLGEELAEMSAYLKTQKDFSSLYAPNHTVAILTASILLSTYLAQAESEQLAGLGIAPDQVDIAERAVLAVADDLMRRAESSQAG